MANTDGPGTSIIPVAFSALRLDFSIYCWLRSGKLAT